MIGRKQDYFELSFDSIAGQQKYRLCKPQTPTLYLKNDQNTPATIIRAMTSANLVLNNSTKITNIKQKYNRFLQHEIAINFSSPNARLLTYSNSFGSYHEKNFFSNAGNVPIEPLAQSQNTGINK